MFINLPIQTKFTIKLFIASCGVRRPNKAIMYFDIKLFIKPILTVIPMNWNKFGSYKCVTYDSKLM